MMPSGRNKSPRAVGGQLQGSSFPRTRLSRHASAMSSVLIALFLRVPAHDHANREPQSQQSGLEELVTVIIGTHSRPAGILVVGFSSRSHRTRRRCRHLLRVLVEKIKSKGRMLICPRNSHRQHFAFAFFLEKRIHHFQQDCFCPAGSVRYFRVHLQLAVQVDLVA
jgi:hypothetical protein